MGRCYVTPLMQFEVTLSVFFISFLPASCLSAAVLLYSGVDGRREKC